MNNKTFGPVTFNYKGLLTQVTPVFSLFLFYIFIWWLQLGERFSNLRIEAFVAFFLLVILIIKPFPKKPEEKANFKPYVLCFFVVLLIQVINSWNTERSWFIFTERVLKYSAMGLFISYFVRSPNQLRLLIFMWLFACFKGTSEGVIGGIDGSLVWENQGIPRLHGNGLWSHPNSFSQFALGTLPFVYYLFPVVKRKWLKVSLFMLFIFAMYCIIYTGSRTGYLGVICLSCLFFYEATKKNKLRIIGGSLVLAIIWISFSPESYQERFMSSFIGKEKAGASKQSRINLYKEGWFIFTHHPFGVGVGNYPLAGMKYFGYKQEQHCLYTQALTHIGIHGFVIFIALLWKIFYVLRAVLRKLADLLSDISEFDYSSGLKADVEFVYAVAKATMVYFALRLFLDIFGMDLYGIGWWFVIGLASSITYISSGLQSRINLETEAI